jgi:hypothetical protein
MKLRKHVEFQLVYFRSLLLHNLAEIQQGFQKYILTENLEIEKEIASTPKVLASERLNIYRDGYYLRLLEVLESDYPVLYKLIGCEKFDHIGRGYSDAYTSSYRSVRWFGKYLADYLKKINQSIELSWQSELALFEWLLTEAFDAPNSLMLTIEEMAKMIPEKWPVMRFKLQPSLRRFSATWNITQLWQANIEDKGDQEDHKKEKLKNLKPQKLERLENFIIWRKEYQIKFCILSIEQDYIITAMLENNNFGDICNKLSQWMDQEQVVMYAAQYLKTLITDGVIAECIVE